MGKRKPNSKNTGRKYWWWVMIHDNSSFSLVYGNFEKAQSKAKKLGLGKKFKSKKFTSKDEARIWAEEAIKHGPTRKIKLWWAIIHGNLSIEIRFTNWNKLRADIFEKGKIYDRFSTKKEAEEWAEKTAHDMHSKRIKRSFMASTRFKRKSWYKKNINTPYWNT